jgi:competence ComEA-like helix-hairpin-helix protein
VKGCQKFAVLCFCLPLVLVLWVTQDLCAKKKPPAHPVNLNTATSEEFQQVPGIGPSTAQKILQARKSYAAFKSVDDLQAIQGLGPKRLEKMRKYLIVGKPAPTSKAPKGTVTKPPPGTQTPTPSDDEEEQ